MSGAQNTILVTGATGMLGRAVVARLVAEGLTVRALSRHPRPATDAVEWVVGDVATGAGLQHATAGATAVIHLASAPYRRSYTREVELGGTSRLLAEARLARVTQFVYTSIVGCDRIPWGYFRTKVAAEHLVREGPVPWTILRLGQFYDFVDQALSAMARTGVMVADRRVVAQPVDTADVASRVVATLRAGPTRTIEEFAGPEVLDLRTAAQQWLAATGKRRAMLPVRLPGELGKRFRAGHLTTQSQPRGTRPWRDYLRDKYTESALATRRG
ncbi:SDR family oxidoreductase [Pseudactinotalea sp.]|uniref:SDR family oxidoreductase n=1 Tax=Pseudactinotalea sp. TaxID=1926260 RepID=UPI003B3A94AC